MKINKQLGISQSTKVEVPESGDGIDAEYNYAFGDGIKNFASNFVQNHPVAAAILTGGTANVANAANNAVQANKPPTNISNPPPVLGAPTTTGNPRGVEGTLYLETQKPTEASTFENYSTAQKIGLGLGIVAVVSGVSYGIYRLYKHFKK